MLNYSYCRYPEDIELPFELVVRFINQLKELKLFNVGITGGEPLLYYKFEKLLDFLKDIHLVFSRRILLTLRKKYINKKLYKCINVLLVVMIFSILIY